MIGGVVLKFRFSIYIFFAGLSGLIRPVSGQVYFPADSVLYGDQELPRIDISISQADLNDLYANPYADEEKMAGFTFSGNGITESLDQVGIRFKGNTSLNNQKKSFKISFNTYVPGRKFYGVEKLNISAEVNDPSMLRANLCWKLYRKLGLPAPRSNHIRLYVNGEFYGLYHNVEQIDENLMKSRLGAGYGNLYKCLWPADLEYLGSDPEAYKYYSGDRQPYDLQVNEEYDDYNDLAEMIAALHNLDGTDFRNSFEKYFNVQSLLKIMALDVMTGNWDDYIYNKNNYYLYRDPLSGRFELYPYDMDNTFGIDWVGEDWGTRSVYNWNNGSRPLYTKVLSIPEFRKQYTAYLLEIGDLMESDWFKGEMERIHNLLRTYLSSDSYYSADYGYTLADFDQTLSTAWGGQVKYGILNFITTRVNTMKSEAGTIDAAPLVTYFRTLFRGDSCEVFVSAEDDSDPVGVTLLYQLDAGTWHEVLMEESPELYDPFSGRKQYRSAIRDLSAAGSIGLYVSVTAGAQTTKYPVQPVSMNIPPWQGPLLINEILASNSSVNQDKYGEFDDWAEVYNAGSSQLLLSNYFLSDDEDNPDKYRFPDDYLAAGGFRLIWLDGQAEQGEDHASFKLNKEGEELRLSAMPSTGFGICDLLVYKDQTENISYGRSEDGADTWQLFSFPTPGFSNLSTSVPLIPGSEPAFYVYPNPVSGGVVQFSKQATVSIYSITGQLLMSRDNITQLLVDDLLPGVYLIITSEGESTKLLVR